ncbi:Hypothetical Protein FCC1311_013402 [Hondaea fermentalgiana]|uniref:Uncharacterized protein n=1 Tax=Hondaea fermentalgiana TaxID=2315210 RepID=A0A2R5G9F7_9STRA|nr:Hypothetical Protein FCC1311_013402 [Hondaea fermentalgiana]|eukprot:GBG25123.1 Hypothetical Protein FCC1311_013402 [Hondaea fermentalgiana]
MHNGPPASRGEGTKRRRVEDDASANLLGAPAPLAGLAATVQALREKQAETIAFLNHLDKLRAQSVQYKESMDKALEALEAMEKTQSALFSASNFLSPHVPAGMAPRENGAASTSDAAIADLDQVAADDEREMLRRKISSYLTNAKSSRRRSFTAKEIAQKTRLGSPSKVSSVLQVLEREGIVGVVKPSTSERTRGKAPAYYVEASRK